MFYYEGECKGGVVSRIVNKQAIGRLVTILGLARISQWSFHTQSSNPSVDRLLIDNSAGEGLCSDGQVQIRQSEISQHRLR